MSEMMDVLNYICNTDMLVSIIVIGPPGSGKTHLAQQLREAHPDLAYVSSDAIRSELTEDYQNTINNREVFEIAHQRFCNYLNDGYSTIFDATNCHAGHRAELVKKARKSDSFVIGIVYNGRVLKCLEQNKERENVVPEYVIERMYYDLRHRPPALIDGFDLLVGFGDEVEDE